MKSAVETLSPTRAKLTVEVPFEELKPSLDAAYKQIAQQINVPGFRRGKVPPMVIDRQGVAVRAGTEHVRIGRSGGLNVSLDIGEPDRKAEEKAAKQELAPLLDGDAWARLRLGNPLEQARALLLDVTDDGALGVVLNRPSQVLVADVLENPRDAANIEAVRAKVHALTSRFPVYR